MAKLVNKFLVGCDPEGVALNPADGKLVNVGLGNLVYGVDHGGRVWELRPEPARGTYELTKRLKELIAKAETLHKFKLRAGAYIKAEAASRGETLGGHIWLDLPYDAITTPVRVAALDSLTDALERVEILPRQQCITRRQISGYGSPGDVRWHPDRTRFEYRSMPSWLFSPRVAFMCLTAAKLAAAAPEHVRTTLRGEAEWKKLVQLFETFAGKDINVDRFLEKLASKGLKAVQGDPEADVRQAWEGKLGF